MRATISFNLPEEQDDYETFMKSPYYASVLDEIQREVRKIWKYREFKTDEARAVVDEIYNLINQTMKEE